MSKTLENKIGSTIYDCINSARMSDAERQVAIKAMHDAETIVDAIMWIGGKFEQLGAFFLKPSLKPSLKS